jgi:hypothetical protein
MAETRTGELRPRGSERRKPAMEPTRVSDGTSLGRTPAPTVTAARVPRVDSGLAAVVEAMRAAPKSVRWRARERVGRRVKWYRTVEEVW